MSDAADRGFTLVEMMIVLAVLAMGAVFLGPMLHRGTSQRDLEALGRRIVLAARGARLDAMRRNSESALAFDPQDRSLRVLPGPQRIVLPPDVTTDFKAGREVDLGGLATIRFLPDGRSSGGAIRLSAASSTLRLDVDWLTGWIRPAQP